MSGWVKLLLTSPPPFSGFPPHTTSILQKTKTCGFRLTNLTVLIAYLKSKLPRFSVLLRHYTMKRISDSHGNVHGDSNLPVCYRRVTDVSQGLWASILRAKQSKQSGMLDPNNDGTRSSETSVIIYQSAWRNIPQGLNLQITKVRIILYFPSLDQSFTYNKYVCHRLPKSSRVVYFRETSWSNYIFSGISINYLSLWFHLLCTH
jgi:hypothetical protein